MAEQNNSGTNGGKNYQYRGSTPMFDKLSSLRDRGHIRRNNDGIKDPSPSPMDWIEDGIDHINVWEDAQTDLGKVLSHNSSISFTHNIFGKFGSMEAFWHYIQSKERDDRIRTMSDETLKYFAKKLTTARIVNFRAIIADTNWQRIKQYSAIIDAMRESVLPFDCYYINSQTGLRTRPSFFKWLTRGFDEARAAIKENREPNFAFLLDHQNTGIYDYVVPEYLKNRKAPDPKSPRTANSKQVSRVFAEKLQQDKTNNEETAAAAVAATPLITTDSSEAEKVGVDFKRGENPAFQPIDEMAYTQQPQAEVQQPSVEIKYDADMNPVPAA